MTVDYHRTRLRSLLSPVVCGASRLPVEAVGTRPVLFVGNHTLMGLYDLPILMLELYLRGFKVCCCTREKTLTTRGSQPVCPHYSATPALLFVRNASQARGLAHPLHWKGPLGGAFERFGAVKASPRAMYSLLQANQQVLLFPGGAREVCGCSGCQ